MAWGKKKRLVMGEVDDKIGGAKAEEEVVRGEVSGGGEGGGGEVCVRDIGREYREGEIW